jgi:hypothetical protein
MISNRIRFNIIHFLVFITFLAISGTFFLNYHKNLAITEINISLKKRLSDYQNIFTIIKTNITNVHDIRTVSTYSQQQIYLTKGRNVTFGEIECKFINKITGQELSRWNNPSSRLQDLLIRNSLISFASSAYSSPDIASELLVDIGYSFELDSYKCLLKTAVLLKDLMIYSPYILKFTSKPKEESFSLFSTTYYHPGLNVYIEIEISHKNLLLYCLVCFILYILCTSRYFFKQALKKSFRLKDENKTLKKTIETFEEKNTVFENLCVGGILKFKKNSDVINKICIFEIINASLGSFEKKIKDHRLNFSVDKQYTSLKILNKKSYLSLFFNLFIQHLVKEYPPNSVITCTISVENEENGCSVAKIIFQDDLTFTSEINERFFSSTIQLPSSIQIIINDLIEELNMFVELSSSFKDGNKTIIAIPSMIPHLKNLDLVPNVLRFNRSDSIPS